MGLIDWLFGKKHRVDLDKVEPVLGRLSKSCFDREDPELFPCRPYHPHLPCADSAVRSLVACDLNLPPDES